MEGKGDFDILNDNQIISVSNDCMMYIFDLNEKERIISKEIECEMNSVAIHPLNRKIFCMGGKDKVVKEFDNYESMN